MSYIYGYKTRNRGNTIKLSIDKQFSFNIYLIRGKLYDK